MLNCVGAHFSGRVILFRAVGTIKARNIKRHGKRLLIHRRTLRHWKHSASRATSHPKGSNSPLIEHLLKIEEMFILGREQFANVRNTFCHAARRR